ncbi:MAG TPA: hypothetical protein PLA03_13505 [Acidobacteriota bacterium]|jgi:hypothetical protein|nr:hypothetical protein [Acidobacteriota bacterium]HNT18427.1 hypothetical protein [Acidobacteriota bacterium]HQO21351.1 hypothetical protein [Acidobacteriota bacterium]
MEIIEKIKIKIRELSDLRYAVRATKSKTKSGYELAAVRRCPLCEGRPSRHFLFKLATSIQGSEIHKELEKSISQKKWEEASQIKEWSPKADLHEYWVLKCPNNGEMALLGFVFTFELFAPDYHDEPKKLTTEESEVIGKIIGEQWIQL